MPFTNFDSRHFSEAEKASINSILSNLEGELEAKLANLSAEERQQYGSVNEQNKLIINKVKDFHDAQPNLSSPDVDWEEFQNDYDTRAYLQIVMQRLESLIEGLKNAKVLHDWDNYQASMDDYQFAKYKTGTNAIGYRVKADEIAQFFTGGENTGASPQKKADNNSTPPQV